MPLPFEPENEELFKERFEDALNPVCVIEDITKVGEIRPGQLRKHVFDYNDGTRLIVSRDKVADIGTFLHVSVSFCKVPPLVGKELLQSVVEKVNSLRGVIPGIVKAFESKDGVVHLLFSPPPPDLGNTTVNPKTSIKPSSNPSWN